MSMIKPGHTSLNMEDVAEDLEVTYRHITKVPAIGPNEAGQTVDYREGGSLSNPVKSEYRHKIVKADDTDLVAGAKANEVAIATGSGDRTTIRNATLLDNHPASYFMPASDGSNVKEKANTLKENYGADITSLRDELYQLKHTLEKKGLIHVTNEHFGYNDIFRAGYKPYMHEMLGKPTVNCPNRTTIRLSPDAVKNIDAGDFIAIYYKDAEKVEVRQVKSVGSDLETLTLDEAMGSAYNIKKDNIEVYKSYGVSRDGNFYFARDVEYKIGDENIYSGLDDDTVYTYYKPVTKEDSSYGYSFRVPESKLGFFTKFKIWARATGVPTLTCYIIDEQDIGYFRNPLQAERLYKNGDMTADGEAKMHFFAKSQPVNIDPTLGETVVTFDFWDEELEAYPRMTRKDTPTNRVRYVAIICGTFIDQNNFAEIRFLQDQKNLNDLEINNTVYLYDERTDTSTLSALSTTEELQKSDMYYEVVMREALKNEMDPLNRGLYTAKLECPMGQSVSRARMTLRFAREGGLWDADLAEPGVYGGPTAKGSFNAVCYRNFPDLTGSFPSAIALGVSEKIRKPMELRANTTDLTQDPDMIVGNNLTHGQAMDNMVASTEPLYVRPYDPVYRNAYVISVKGKFYKYNTALQKYEVTSQKKIYLKPIAVIPDGNKETKDVYSDRIIFEGDFTDASGNPMFFNQLEFQVYWERPTFSEIKRIKDSQMGIIHDLVFSTDRAVTWN